MEEDGSVIIVAESVDEFEGAVIPEEPKGWGGARMVVRRLVYLFLSTHRTHHMRF